MLTVIAVWTDTGRTDGRMDGRTDAKAVLYSVQCCTLHWTDKNIFSYICLANSILIIRVHDYEVDYRLSSHTSVLIIIWLFSVHFCSLTKFYGATLLILCSVLSLIGCE